ncbi:hypothetical protein [Thiomicrorhabdus sp. Kp2]|uniref:hypothetical protein n=1 Tax=Thiomicrorhabdus sp. Kp2 TaxID=1123518 RepID=UPI00040C5D15|nr:hypothetical protein [Thiomicrorhabdus sp. Kp2]
MHWLHTVNLRSLLLPGLVISLLFSSNVYSDTSVLPIAKNLQELGKQATKQNLPIAILFSAKGLKSTDNLKDEAIVPTLYSGALDGFVLMTEINVNVDETTIDFYGEATANAEFKALYNLTSLPVVIFVNGEGEVITNQLLSGAYDFYPFYLKQSINQALKALGNPKQIAD